MNKESRAFKIVELVIDEADEQSGIEAISVVESPAIEENFVALNKHEILLKEVDSEKRILTNKFTDVTTRRTKNTIFTFQKTQ